jgi:hypothetical protein
MILTDLRVISPPPSNTLYQKWVLCHSCSWYGWDTATEEVAMGYAWDYNGRNKKCIQETSKVDVCLEDQGEDGTTLIFILGRQVVKIVG